MRLFASFSWSTLFFNSERGNALWISLYAIYPVFQLAIANAGLSYLTQIMTVQEAMSLAAESYRSGDLDRVILICESILSQTPGYAEPWFLLSLSHYQKGNVESAVKFIRQAISIQPGNMEYFYNLGVMLTQLKQRDEAIKSFQRAAELPARDAHMLAKLARAFLHSGDSTKAAALCRDSLAAEPREPEALEVLSNSLFSMGQFDAALEAARQAAAARPDYAVVRWNFANLLLLHGQFAEGWREFEWRKLVFHRATHQRFTSPAWDGSPIPNGTLLVYSEGGFGDTLQYVRYVPMLAERVGRIVLECRKPLIPLLATIAGVTQIIEAGSPFPAFDRHISLPSLPGVFGTDLLNIPGNVPYLSIPAEYRQRWAGRVPSDGILNVGLCWRGNQRKISDRRGDSLEAFAPLAAIPGVRFFSLQIGHQTSSARPAGLELVDYAAGIGDFADTAALVSQLDLVISVDTSVAHLAGALARPIWLLVPFIPDYRWLLHRTDSPWYPTMRLFRQRSAREWAGTIMHLAKELILESRFRSR